MKLGKRRLQAEPPDADPEPVADAAPQAEPDAGSWTAPEPTDEPSYGEGAIDGEAVELPADGAAAEALAAVAEPPPAVTYDPPPAVTYEPPPAASFDDGSGAAEPAHAHGPPASWQEPLTALIDERPEVLVGAAFAGGLLTAMILRRLGS